jgi:predicted RNA-binding protein Jag
MSDRFEGRTLEEALQSAAETLGVERWQLTYHVVMEKRGFLGGVKRVVVEADVNASAPPPPAGGAQAPVNAGQAPFNDHDAHDADDAQPRYTPRPSARAAEPRSAGPILSDRGGEGGGGRGGNRGRRGGGGGGGRGRDAQGGSGGGGRRGGGRGRGRSEPEFQPSDEPFLGEIPPQGPETDSTRAVREWCETVLALAKLSMAVRTEENETQILVRLYGSDAKLMIDRHGELLDALQVLANKALVGRSVEKDVELDCEQFKERRSADLEVRAREVADRVRRAGREELLPAMSPIERRIVHIALRDDADVTTESRGDGFYKRVAIILRSEAKDVDATETDTDTETQPAQEP